MLLTKLDYDIHIMLLMHNFSELENLANIAEISSLCTFLLIWFIIIILITCIASTYIHYMLIYVYCCKWYGSHILHIAYEICFCLGFKVLFVFHLSDGARGKFIKYPLLLKAIHKYVSIRWLSFSSSVSVPIIFLPLYGRNIVDRA